MSPRSGEEKSAAPSPPTAAWPLAPAAEEQSFSLASSASVPGPLQPIQAKPASQETQREAELRNLLSSRIRIGLIITWLLALGVLLEHVLPRPMAEVPRPASTVVLIVGLVVFFVLSVVTYVKRDLSLATLRRVELCWLLMGMLFCAIFRFESLTQPPPVPFEGPHHEGAYFERMLLLSNLQWYCIITAYGVFIPNTWRRCIAVVAGMIAVPTLMLVLAALVNPIVARYLPFAMGVNFIGMSFFGAMAVYGSYKISTLAEEAFAARQLGQYRLLKKLGAGGMGEVYLAEHRLLKRACAVKLIRSDRASDPNILERFEREVQAMSRLRHFNTAEVFDYGRTDDGVLYYVMEYLPGLSLDGLVERHGPVPPPRAIHFLRQLCAALREAHGIGLIHRDIKPGNVLVCRLGGLHDVVKLLDFGLVRVLRSDEGDARKLTQQGFTMGTPDYMSPEQATAEDAIDPRSDLYSFGGLAYFLLTGHPPFVGKTTLETLMAHIQQPVPLPRTIRPDLPADLEAILLRCLAKDPRERYPDAASLDEALAQCRDAGRWTEADASQWWQSHGTEQEKSQSTDKRPALGAATVASR